METKEYEWILVKDETFLSDVLLKKIVHLDLENVREVSMDYETVQVLNMLNINEVPSFGFIKNNKFFPIAEGNIGIRSIKLNLKKC
ncbi:MAG: hypothetical protein L0L86_09185, partial [Lactococcus lactis]|nr:hypothetical protein [Lactococcus lactis]